MMWERCTELVTAKGTKVVFDSDGHQDRARRRPRHRGHRDQRRRHRPLRVHRRHLVDADQRAARGDGPAGARRGAQGGRRRCATATSSPSRSWCPRSTASPTTGSTSTTPTSKVGRIQNFGRWSPYLVKDGRTCLGLEFFVNEGDEMVDEVRRRPHRAGQARARSRSACVDRVEGRGRLRRAHAEGVPVLRRGVQGATSRRCAAWLEEHTPNVYPVGRNGMHRYNNQDHSMYTAMLSVENIFGAHHDVWSVNVEEEYHEEVARRRRRADPG